MTWTLALMGAIAAAGATSASAQTTCAGQAGPAMVKLSVAATDLRNSSGEMAITLYGDSKSRFLAKGGKLARQRVPAHAPTTSVCFWVKPGAYAVATYHDENGDHDFNRTLFAIKEGFGFSNDAPTTLGLPSFSAARFLVPASGAAIRIRTRYQR